MSNIFFTSDTHFFHESILTLGKGRPFADVEEMNHALIDNWNDRVRPGDLVYHLGDFTFGGAGPTLNVVRHLRGQIHFVKGNHDSVMARVIRDVPNKFASHGDYKEIKYSGHRIVMFHFPILSWHQAHRGSWHLHGHCHGDLQWTNGPMLDVGVDVHKYAPVAVEEIADIMATKPAWVPLDHHDKPLTAI